MIGQILHMVQIDQKGAVRTNKAATVLQLLAQLIQTSCTFQNLSTAQVDKQGPVDHLAVFQLTQLDPGDAGFAQAASKIQMP